MPAPRQGFWQLYPGRARADCPPEPLAGTRTCTSVPQDVPAPPLSGPRKTRGRGEGLTSRLATAPSASGPDISPGPALLPAPHGAQGPPVPNAPPAPWAGPGRPGLGCPLRPCGGTGQGAGQGQSPNLPRTGLHHLVTGDPPPQGFLARATRAHRPGPTGRRPLVGGRAASPSSPGRRCRLGTVALVNEQ